MDSSEILQYLNFIVGDYYHYAVISASELPLVDIKDGKDSFIIVHVPIQDETHGHFVVFEVSCERPVAQYFDSFGLDAKTYFDNIPFQIVSRNDRALQNPKSNLCGFYSLFFIYHRIHSNLYHSSFLSLFVSNTNANDNQIVKFIQRLRKWVPNQHKQVETNILKSGVMRDMVKKLNA